MAVATGTNIAIDYTQDQKDIVFGIWYKNGRPSLQRLLLLLPDDLKPSHITLIRWKSEGFWDERAELIDIKSSENFDGTLAVQRTEMMNRHANAAKELQEKAMDYLRTNEIDNIANALKALSLGVEIEQKSRGVGAVSKILVSSDDEIKNKLSEMISRLTPEVIDSTLENIEDEDDLQDEETSNS